MTAATPGPVSTRAKVWVVVAAILGAVLAIGVVGWIGLGAVASALAAIGWRGLGFLCVYTALPFALLATAWFLLVPGLPIRRWWVFVAARMVRDAGSELLPFSHVGGFVFGARAAVLGGLAPALASSTTVADVTTELIAQLGFVGLGLATLAIRLGAGASHAALLEAGFAGLLVSGAGVAGLVALQRRGIGFLEALARRWLPAAASAVTAFGLALNALYDRPLRLAVAVATHLAAWIASAAGVWLALRLAGVEIGLPAVLAIEALVCAVRGAAFVAPMGLGVQEATYVVVGPLFGLGLDMSLAVSLTKRGRDMIVGIPALLIWQALEGRRLVRAVGAQNDLSGNLD